VSINCLPALNLGRLEAAIAIFALVFGLKPSEAFLERA